ncbi:MAG TPA: hypothetical protein PKJ37_08260 [Acidobacteriota bacterium]|nr:hypothetical protein [Acidobacteriota bacterium]HNT17867.1 hypothetical protein [Acidobacteriota bacterium]
MLRKLLRFCGDLRLSFWLLMAIFFCIVAGVLHIGASPDIFRSLKYSLMSQWLQANLAKNFSAAWWIPPLLSALFLFGLNISACAADRILSLLRQWRTVPAGLFFLKLAPSLMHVCFIVMLTGHFMSLCGGSGKVIAVKPGEAVALGRSQMKIVGRICEYCGLDGPMKDGVEQCTVVLEFSGGTGVQEESISFFEPIVRDGASIHLLPDSKLKKTSLPPELKLLVKRDEGKAFIVAGFIMMILLMLWYFPQLKKIEREE